MGGHAWSVTSEDAKCERGRKSKIRARHDIYAESRELQLLLFNFLADYTVMGAGPAENLLLLSRACSWTQTCLVPNDQHAEESLSPIGQMHL